MKKWTILEWKLTITLLIQTKQGNQKTSFLPLFPQFSVILYPETKTHKYAFESPMITYSPWLRPQIDGKPTKHKILINKSCIHHVFLLVAEQRVFFLHPAADNISTTKWKKNFSFLNHPHAPLLIWSKTHLWTAEWGQPVSLSAQPEYNEHCVTQPAQPPYIQQHPEATAVRLSPLRWNPHEKTWWDILVTPRTRSSLIRLKLGLL